MSISRTKLCIALLAVVLVVAACGSDNDGALSGEPRVEDEVDFGSEDSDDDAMDDEAMGDEDDSVSTDAEAPAEDRGSSSSDPSSDPSDAEADTAEDSDEAQAPDAADGGFFDDPEVEEEEPVVQDYGIRPFVETDRDPLSTFALDVDTGAYSVARRLLESGSLPPPESVRVEEYVNSFDYDYDAPVEGLAIQADGGPSPYDSDNVIVRVGVQAEVVANADRPDAALTFVVDTSGSMDRADRLSLVKTSLERLTLELDADDTVAIVTYSSDAQIVLEPTPVSRRDVILDAIDRLRPTGSTNLEAGLATGYALADDAFRQGGINRVILASDGIANVGLTDPAGLSQMIRDDADRGIQLVTVGVGLGGFNDELMEQLADRGDGFYAYVDDVGEAERLFGDELVSTLLTVALDGKIQVEFDADAVQRYRLIGFENRAVLDDDFRNDAVDAGELGAGHQVTALYELTLRSNRSDDDLGVIRLRWEDPDDGSVDETSLRLEADIIESTWGDTDRDFRLAVTVAAWAELLRSSPHTGDVDFDQVRAEAEALSPGNGPIEELVGLIELSGG